MERFESIRIKELSLMERLQRLQLEEPRQNYGYRFLKEH